MCRTSEAEQRQPIWGRETVQKQIRSEQSEAGVWERAHPGSLGRNRFRAWGSRTRAAPFRDTRHAPETNVY